MMSFPEKWTSNDWTIRNFTSSIFSSKLHCTFCCTFSNCRHNMWYSKHKPLLLTSAPSFHPGVPFCTQAIFKCEGNQFLVNYTLIFVIFPGFYMMQDEVQRKLQKKMTFVFGATTVFITKLTPLLKSTYTAVWEF